MTSASIDLERFKNDLDQFKDFLLEDLKGVATSQEFIDQAVIYMDREMLKAYQAGAHIPEGSSMQVRGQTWRGWAEHPGKFAVQGTRFYYRAFARGARGTVRTGTGRLLKKYGGVNPLKSGELEKVWRRRASGALYSEASNLMADTGMMRAQYANIQPTVTAKTIELRPYETINYFEYQDAMRPVFVFDNPTDENKLAGILVKLIGAKIAKRLGGES